MPAQLLSNYVKVEPMPALPSMPVLETSETLTQEVSFV